MRLTGPIPPRDALAIYLQDHLAGAQGGIALARRAARNQSGSPAGPVLEGIVADIEEDEQALRRVMEGLDVPPSRIKGRGAELAERAGRFKLNGQLLGSSPLSPVVELEGLLMGVKSKQHVWTLLRDAADVPLSGVDPERMLERAEDQLDRLHALWSGAARAAFPRDAATRSRRGQPA